MRIDWRIHIILWLAYFGLEILSNYFHYPRGERGQMLVDISQYMPFIIVSTYLLYLKVIPSFLVNRNLPRLVVSVFAMLLLIYIGRYAWAVYDFNIGGERIDLLPWSKVVKSVIRDMGMVALMSSMLFIKDWARQESEISRVKRVNAEQRLELVIQQLQPHFLFNTINNIYSLMQSKPEVGAESLLELSDVLDYFLHIEINDMVYWEKEREIAEKYIALHRLKYGDSLRASWNDDLMPTNLFPPFILITLLENAFKHGRKRSGLLELEINIRKINAKVALTVSNTTADHPTDRKKQRGNQLLESLLEIHFGPSYAITSDQSMDFYTKKIQWHA